MHPHHAVFHLAATAAPLPLGAGRMRTALDYRRLVDDADRLGMGMLAGYQLLATLAQSFLVPLDQFQKSL
jgi:hypothetical protein